jgi:hypothetical protein
MFSLIFEGIGIFFWWPHKFRYLLLFYVHLVRLLYALTKMFVVVKMHFLARGELCSYSSVTDKLTDRTQGTRFGAY